METIKMSTMERKRMTLMTRVAEGLLKLREAAEMMRVSYRQARRIRRRYQQEGDAGLVHQGRGRKSNRRRPDNERKRALALYSKEYAGFGPLLASGEADIGFQQISELMPEPGIEIVGPLPPELQKMTVFVAAVSSGAKAPDAAKALAAYLAAPAAAPVMKKHGVEPA